MMGDQVYDAIVVGAGVEGSATAFQLRRRGVQVLLLEQFPLPHSRGSSHGQSRITRKAYPEPFYTDMMHYCTHQWLALQHAFGQEVFRQMGFLTIGELKSQTMKDVVSSMERNRAPYQLLTQDKFRAKYPNMVYGDGWGAVYDPNGGMLMADKAVQAFQSLYVKLGGQLHDGEPVVSVQPGQQTVRVVTAKGSYRTKAVVLCCGPWTNKLLKPLQLQLPLRPVRISVCYWPEKEPGSYNAQNFTPFYEDAACGGHDVYGLPSEEYPGHAKICLHQGPNIDPDRRDDVDHKWTVDLIKGYVRKHYPGLVPEPSVVETCIYTWTPDHNFILDRHPAYKNIIIGAGFSGHGFKLAPAVGKILSDLALDLPPEYDISHFKISRFPQTGNAQSNL